MAVAVAAAVAYQQRAEPVERASAGIWEEVLRRTPAGETHRKLASAAVLGDLGEEEAARVLGSGFLITTPDTVPFVVWSAARNLGSYTEALLRTLSVGGDTDTNCAMVGGIVALYTGAEGIPQEWRAAREEYHLANLP